MALFFSLAIECGAEQSAAKKIGEHFDGFRLCLAAPNDSTHSRCRTVINQDKDAMWWCEIFPSGISLTGDDRNFIKSKEQVLQVIAGLYARLKHAPSFRYAAPGFEIWPFDTYAELLKTKEKQHGYFRGMVISKETWDVLDRPKDFELFSEHTYWLPLQETDIQI